MQKYQINHRIGSFYMPYGSITILAKNGIQALRKAADLARKKFEQNKDRLDIRLVVNGHKEWDYDKKPIEDKYCIGICIYKEHYFEIEKLKN